MWDNLVLSQPDHVSYQLTKLRHSMGIDIEEKSPNRTRYRIDFQKSVIGQFSYYIGKEWKPVTHSNTNPRPYHPGSGSHGQLFQASSAKHNHRAEIGLKCAPPQSGVQSPPLSANSTADVRVIWLCACTKYWPDWPVGWCSSVSHRTKWQI